MKVVIFGTGKRYHDRKSFLRQFRPDIEIIAFLDNNESIIKCDGFQVYRPADLYRLNYDYVLVMSDKSLEMRQQLVDLRVPLNKILEWEDVISNQRKLQLEYYRGERESTTGKRVLLLSDFLCYVGGIIAIVYAAKALSNIGLYVCIVSKDGDLQFVEEVNRYGLDVVLLKSLDRFEIEERDFFKQFDYVIVNTFQMVRFAIEMCEYVPVLAWFHEPEVLVRKTIRDLPPGILEKYKDHIELRAVSEIPRRLINPYVDGQITKLLRYGIPDHKEISSSTNNNQKIVFAVIGVICERKGQDIFIDASDLLLNYAERFECWCVGKQGSDNYVKSLMMKTDNHMLFIDELNREEMQILWPKIDVLVCSSREDPLPIVCTESMMYGKPVIVSDNTGTAQYIESGKNGFVFETGNANDLAEKMRWIIENQECLDMMGQNARKVYDNYFTMDAFAENLVQALTDAEKKFSKRRVIN